MKLLLLGLALSGLSFAEETAETSAIRLTVERLNQQPARSSSFSPDSDAGPKLADLYLTTKPRVTHRPISAARPHLVIRHEPWAEAQSVVPGPTLIYLNPRIVCGSIRLVTDDVAIADASFVNKRPNAVTERTPLMLVLRKDDDQWKIASLRVLADH